MANKVNMTLRIEPELKRETASLFESLGLDMSTATGLFYRQALRCHGLPFDVRIDEPNETTYAAMESAENGTDIYGPYDDTAELMAALHA
ncbi:type II toxin-antitoxin system RelB/DinJ family antitoxin [Adlercreutzia murintestinalis]|jgi:addiction module antitoxin, RelB/DinJ family|uniref:type II toxin-antitoxin system RelB/DinJ family antitoxin n=1 Tax=Adlercreutzia murintestinalis TaxID=2941325 RepID=UPI00204234E5|nr:type II toxin-antitoxin system RelB/DinJ family antitoxin [Adlercreutzia murintestinalis]